jgi:hypothetical protein
VFILLRDGKVELIFVSYWTKRKREIAIEKEEYMHKTKKFLKLNKKILILNKLITTVKTNSFMASR